MKIDITKKYQTRDGKPVKLYSIDNGGHYPIHGAIFEDGEWCVDTWSKDGKYLPSQVKNSSDLIPVPEKIKIKKTVWINVYPNNRIGIHPYQDQADTVADLDRVACVEHTIDIEVEI